MGRVRISVTYDLLVDMLRMPTATQIVGVSGDQRRWVTFIVEHPDLPEADGVPPLVTPRITHRPEEYLWDWNLPSDEPHRPT